MASSSSPSLEIEEGSLSNRSSPPQAKAMHSQKSFPQPTSTSQAIPTQAPAFFGTPRLYTQHGAPSPVAARLGHVAERFSSFYNDLESEKQHRRDAENQRRHTFNEQLNKLERSLEVRLFFQFLSHYQFICLPFCSWLI